MWDATYSRTHLDYCSSGSLIRLGCELNTMPQIEVSEYVKSELDDVKREEEHKSYDSTIRALLVEYNR